MNTKIQRPNADKRKHFKDLIMRMERIYTSIFHVFNKLGVEVMI